MQSILWEPALRANNIGVGVKLTPTPAGKIIYCMIHTVNLVGARTAGEYARNENIGESLRASSRGGRRPTWRSQARLSPEA